MDAFEPPPEATRPMGLDVDALAAKWPGRRDEIVHLQRLLGRPEDPLPPILVWGHAATGKTTLLREIMQALGRPHAYVNCADCRSSRLMFESVLDQLSGHQRERCKGYAPGVQCEKLEDFDRMVPVACPKDGRTAYVVVDGAERLRTNAGGAYQYDEKRLLAGFTRLRERTGANVGVILISKVPWIQFVWGTAVEGEGVRSLRFPAYTPKQMRELLPRHLEGTDEGLKKAFLNQVMPSIERKGLSLHELKTLINALYRQYRAPISRGDMAANNVLGLYKALVPHIKAALAGDAVAGLSRAGAGAGSGVGAGAGAAGAGAGAAAAGVGQLEYELPYCSKLLLLAAYLASRNPASLDQAVFEGMPSGAPRDGPGRKRRRGDTQAANRHESKVAEARLRGPHPFLLERMLAMYRSLMEKVEQGEEDDEEDADEGLLAAGSGGGGGGGRGDDGEERRRGQAGNAITADVLMAVSSLVSLKLLSLSGSDPLEAGRQYRCNVPDDLAEKIARNVQLKLKQFLLYA